MGVLTGLYPQRVFDYFEELTRIPRGSGNEKAVSDYLVSFAKEHDLFYVQDTANNVIIIKEASVGYEAVEPIIMQGHMDMVAVKDADCPLSLEHDALALAVEGDTIYARGTSLGGDDGIALAYALAVLEDKTLCHPRLEAVFTTDEEVGMNGAAAIDLSVLKGRRLLNIDSEQEGILTVGCAGGVRVHSVIPVKRERCGGVPARVRIHGLQGGHSGAEINKQRGNANSLMGRFLNNLSGKMLCALVSCAGGTKDNAIPVEAEAELIIPAKEQEALAAAVTEYEQILKKEFANRDAGVQVSLTFSEENGAFERGEGDNEWTALDEASTKTVARFLVSVPDGVQAMSTDIKGLVETSLNMGIVRLTENGLETDHSIRSSVASAKDALREKVTALSALAGGAVSCHGDYPAWEYRSDSPLRESMIAQYREMFGKEPKVEVIHAGLECGLLSAKLPGLDCVSFGPDLTDIHTTSERMHIASVGRMYEYLRALIQKK
ncbi:MAG: aminoacyl-histidine dipeptidase [Lachnospiraceae bacterium]|nr:aminoacyl-histidine dipeptidase [Lachnospiraceae bacterium]